MGIKTAELANALYLPAIKEDRKPTTTAASMKSVLVALTIAKNEKTGLCCPGQESLSNKTSLSVATVNRALSGLEYLGVITRKRRMHNSTTYAFHLDVEIPAVPFIVRTSQSTNFAESGSELRSMSAPTSQHERGTGKKNREELNQEVLIRKASFADFWIVWPRSEDKKRAEAAWQKATQRADQDVILRAATEYANHPHRPPRQYVKHAASWLNGDCWNDPLPHAPEPDNRSQSTGDRNLAYLQHLHERQNSQKGITA